MGSLEIRLLGSFHLIHDGETVAGCDPPRLQSFLGYLLLHREAPQSRQRIAVDLWPDSTETQGRNNLRQVLYRLKQALPEPDHFLIIQGKTLQWNNDASCVVDALEFEQSLQRAQQFEEESKGDSYLEALMNAEQWYGGDLLQDCYDEWLLTERERFSRQYVKTLEYLIEHLEQRRDYREAIDYAQQLLENDPLHEGAYRRLMRLYSLTGDHARALRTYRTCINKLERELGVEPSPATREVYEHLKRSQDKPKSTASVTSLGTTDTPLVGRQREWDTLRDAWTTAREKGCRFVFIGGEAGMGKTRLASELLTWANRQGIRTAQTRCYRSEDQLSYGPAIDWLKSPAIWPFLSQLEDVWLTELTRLMPELAAEKPELQTPQPLNDKIQRRRLFEALSRCILVDDEPLLLFIDDLQWCDPETLSWLHYLLRYDPDAALLVIGTARLEEVSPDHPVMDLLRALRSHKQLREITLGPLNRRETSELAKQHSQNEIGSEQQEKIYSETEGHPLFIVESMRTGRFDQTPDQQQENSGASEVSELPKKVQDVIEYRLDQLSSEAGTLVGVAAVMGREFTLETLREVSGQTPETLVDGLDELVQRRIVREEGSEAYDFQHDVIRDVAYQRQTRARRRLLHRRIAERMEQIHAGSLDAVSAEIARHYEKAGTPARAVPYYQRAGERAIRLSAYQEAEHHLNKGMSVLQDQTRDRTSIERELQLRTSLGTTLIALKGWSAPEVKETFETARSQCEEVGNVEHLMPVLRGLRNYYLCRLDLETAQKVTRRYYRLAKDREDQVTTLLSHYLLGEVMFHLGEIEQSLEHMKHALEYCPSPDRETGSFLISPEVGVFCNTYTSHALWLLGYQARAQKKGKEAISRARELSHPLSLVVALNFAGNLHQFLGQPELVQKYIDESIRISREHGFVYYLAWGKFLRGWVEVQNTGANGGVRRMRQGLEELLETGARLRYPYYLGLLAEAYGQADRVQKGLQTIEKARQVVNETEARTFEAELHRIEGDLHRQRDSKEDEQNVKNCLTRALEQAHSRAERSLELRAMNSLVQFRYKQGSIDDALDRLRALYEWFPEGFHSRDLQEAKKLLQQG